MTSSSVTELRRDLERLVSNLFECDSRGAIPALEIDRRNDQLVIYAQVPGAAPGDAAVGVELRLACGGRDSATHSTPRNAASASMTAAPAPVPATAA